MLKNSLDSTNLIRRDRTNMVIPIERDLLMRFKQVSAAKRYRSLSEMVRYAIEQYLKAEGM
jgi:metal-responsive CopG/Arc/MetJ family transcriptional regulator